MDRMRSKIFPREILFLQPVHQWIRMAKKQLRSPDRCPLAPETSVPLDITLDATERYSVRGIVHMSAVPQGLEANRLECHGQTGVETSVDRDRRQPAVRCENR